MTTKPLLGDDQLYRRMQRGDEEAFQTLYRRHQAAVYRFALRMSGSEPVAEDVTQDVFLALMQGKGYDPDRGPLSAYLYGVARHQLLRRWRGAGTTVPLESGEDEGPYPAPGLSTSWAPLHDPLERLTRLETIRWMRRAVLSLPRPYREVLVLCDLQELSYAQAAEVIGCPEGTVRSRLHRARSMLLGRVREARASSPRAFGPRGLWRKLPGRCLT